MTRQASEGAIGMRTLCQGSKCADMSAVFRRRLSLRLCRCLYIDHLTPLRRPQEEDRHQNLRSTNPPACQTVPLAG